MNKLKPILEWMKANWLPVVMGVLGIGGFAGGLFLSQEWGGSVVTDLQKKVDSDVQAVSENANRVTYRIDPVGPGEQAIETPSLPNPKLTEWFKQQRSQRAEAAKSLVSELIKFNQGPREDITKRFLVERLFPKPSESERSLKPREMARAIAEVPAKLLSIVRAGMPPTAEEMRLALNDRRAELLAAKLPPGGGEQALSPEQVQEIARDLASFRVRKYQSRADALGVYADPSAIELPPPPAQGDPSLTLCWDWQTTLWAVEDALRAIALANKPAADRGVSAAVVKRIESIRMFPMPGLNVAREQGPGGGATAPSPTDAAAATPADPNAAPTNPAVSITGRQSGPGTGNGLYDLRTYELRLVVSASGVPQVLDAIAHTNLMSVLDVDLEQVDSVEQLGAGFFYGREPVVRATIVVESLWLREWTTPFMPADVRTALGVPAPSADGTTPPPG